MKTLDSNKQTLYYALFKTNVPIYARDDEGNILYENIDGDKYKKELDNKGLGYIEGMMYIALK